MRRLMSFLSVVLVASLMGLAPAAADIDSNPNASEFGPAQCEDGSYFDNLWTPGGVVGQQVGTNAMGTNHLVWFSNEDGDKLVPLGKPLSPGLEKVTIFCWWEDANSPTGWLGGDIIFNGHGRP